jgi:hypothetical protein
LLHNRLTDACLAFCSSSYRTTYTPGRMAEIDGAAGLDFIYQSDAAMAI